MDVYLTPLAEDCPDVLFGSKFADIEALARGDKDRLRPVISPAARRRLGAAPKPGRQVALIIGGNGFVGAHLAARLSRTQGVERVLATVRPRPDKSPWQRMEDTWAEFCVTDIDRDKIELITCSPTDARLGFSEADYATLSQEVDQVFNCASTTDYSIPYLDLRNDWTIGLLRILQFCLDGKIKRLSYLGSVGGFFYTQPEDFRRPDSWWYSGYCQMKWVNAQLTQWLGAVEGLPVTLVETPYVLGSTRVGKDPGRHYSWWRIIEVARAIGYVWDGPGMNYCPVDILVEALLQNALGEAPMTQMLPCNPHAFDMELIADLLGLQIVSYDRFMAETEARVSPRRYRQVLSSNFDELVRRTNRPARLPEGLDTGWCDNRRLFDLYLRHVDFRDIGRTPTAALRQSASTRVS
ncbi:MAG: SDR family oxidoreductase [Pseudomonadota bacterium]